MSLILLFGGLVAAAWFVLGLPPLPAPAYYGITHGDTSGSYITWGFYGVVLSMVAAFMGLLGILATIAD